MDFKHRLRLPALAALALTACQDGFFFDPAPGRTTPILVQWTLVDAPTPGAAGAPEGPQGAEGPQAGPAAAFDKADGAGVVLRSGEKELFNQRLALEAVGADRRVSFSVDLPAGSAVQASLELTLLRGQDALFTGSATTQLTPGQSAEVTVPLAGVLARVEVGGPYVIRTLGGRLKVTAVGLFATGDSAGLTATYKALDANITVTSDGTVTAVSNGNGRLEASYFGRADTATVTVEDRCFGPYAVLAFGQSVGGTLDANDCPDVGNFSYNDWYQVSLAAPTLFRATLGSSAFVPFVGATRPDKTNLAVAANPTSPTVSEYFFPAGTYLLRTGSRAQAAGPVPTGAYTLGLERVASGVPNDGCTPGMGASWLLPGTEVSAALTTSDCVFSGTQQAYDRWGVRLQKGDTATVTVSGAPPYYLQYSNPGTQQSPLKETSLQGGETVRWVMTGAADASHYLIVSPLAQSTGAYTVRVDPGIPASYDPCAGPDVMMVSEGAFSSFKGSLSPRIDCQEGQNLIERYRLSTASAAGPFTTTLASSDFDPFVAVEKDGRQTAGRSSITGSVTAEHLYPVGAYTIAALARNGVSSGSRFSGAYTISVAKVTTPQEGCPAGGSRTTFVDFGSTARGRITSADCRDLFAPDTATVTRWVDGYSILLQPGETVTVQLVTDFQANFTRWTGGAYVEGHFGVLPNSPVTLTVTQPATDAAFHSFYVISGTHQGTGNYTMHFVGTPNPGPAPSAPLLGR